MIRLESEYLKGAGSPEPEWTGRGPIAACSYCGPTILEKSAERPQLKEAARGTARCSRVEIPMTQLQTPRCVLPWAQQPHVRKTKKPSIRFHRVEDFVVKAPHFIVTGEEF